MLLTLAIRPATLATFIPYACATMLELMLFITDRPCSSLRDLSIDTGIALLAFGYALWAIAGAAADVVLRGTLLFLAGIPLCVLIEWRGRSHRSRGGQGLVVQSGRRAPCQHRGADSGVLTCTG